VAAAENVRLAVELIRGPDGVLYRERRTFRRSRLAGAKAGTRSRHSWTGRRENIRVRG